MLINIQVGQNIRNERKAKKCPKMYLFFKVSEREIKNWISTDMMSEKGSTSKEKEVGKCWNCDFWRNRATNQTGYYNKNVNMKRGCKKLKILNIHFKFSTSVCLNGSSVMTH